MRRRVSAHPLARALQRQAQLGPARASTNRFVVCVSPRKLPAIFLPYYFIFKPPPTPDSGLVTTTITVRLSRLNDFQRCRPPPPPFLPFSLLSLPSLFTVHSHSATSFSLPFRRHPLSSSLLPRHRRRRSFRGAASPQRRDRAHRHFTCVSFARRSRTPLLLFFSSFPTVPSLLFLLDVLSHLLILFCCCHSLSFSFHENCSPPSLFQLVTHRTRYRPIMTVTG